MVAVLDARAGRVGANKVGRNVNVVNAWKVPGDVVREAGALNTSEPHTWTHHATLVPQTRIATRRSTARHPAICSGPGGLAGVAEFARVSIVTEINVVALLGLRAGPRQDKLWCGWAGWGNQAFGFRLPSDIFRRGVFAEKNGGTAPQLSTLSATVSARGCWKGLP